MEKRFYALCLVLLTVCSASVFAQDIYMDPGVGVFLKRFDNETSKGDRYTAMRVNMGIHNLIAGRFGVYGTAEFTKLNGRTETREIIGGNIRINKYLSLFGGMGILEEGLFSGNFKATRKEIGTEISLMNNKLNLDIGISGTGPSFTLGYVIPALVHAGEKNVQNKLSSEKKVADDLTAALKQVDEVKAASAKEVADLRRQLDEKEAALRNAEAARLAAENALKNRPAAGGDGPVVEGRVVTRSRAIEAVTEAATKTKSNYNGAVSLLNGSEVVTFKYGASELSKSFSSKLDQLKKFLDQSPNYSILITGHACDLGTDELNQTLSEARADAVKKYLVKAGLAESRVSVKGMGERAPIVPNNNESNRKKNRRVDFTLLND